MARSRNLRLWALALWGLCLLAATAGAPEGGNDPIADSTPVAAVGALPPDVAVLPARVAEEVRVAAQGAPLRVLVLAAVLAVVAGLPAALRWMACARHRDHQHLRARRYAIALRAPPLQLA